jgi:hypothetical protein
MDDRGKGGARFALLIHHTDSTREWAYDRDPSIGQLDKALDEANAKGWTAVDMKNDWRCVFRSSKDLSLSVQNHTRSAATNLAIVLAS